VLSILRNSYSFIILTVNICCSDAFVTFREYSASCFFSYAKAMNMWISRYAGINAHYTHMCIYGNDRKTAFYV